MKIIDGHKHELTIREARSAIRQAPNVFAGVILIEHGDPFYVRVTKAVALAAYSDLSDDNGMTTCHVAPDGCVYIN